MNNNSNNFLLDIVNEVENFLDERELFVLYSRNGYPQNEFLTLDETAKKMGGITRERVRQIETKAVKRLSDSLKRNDIILKFVLYYDNTYRIFRNIDLDSFDPFSEPSY